MAKKNFWEKTKKFLQEVKIELKKVNWPSQKEVFSYTLVVLVTVLFVSLFIGGIDLVFSKLVSPIILN